MPFSFTVSFFTRVSVHLKSLGVQKIHILRYGQRSPTCSKGDLEIAYLKGTETSYTGKAVSWYSNGQKMLEGNWKDGNIVEGSDKYWNSKGEPVDSEEEATAE